MKVESCQKSCQILDVFLPYQILGGSPSKKVYPRYHPWLVTRRLDKNL